ncbi:hypothetical protein [Pseudoalteromonas sp. SR45-4]|uniref:hypothetical protein n=1 Tax=Pseudoalteromonas sp. SR45-4 TaxID=2760929 RepID=UPI000EED9D5F|nr:hypothetical protein [Pseudoalteromonas sp. SR45-4]MBB1371223.1 hypothetical protein [Pseudoalteromonas sp. SR45-4]HCP96678.1 hypothetical protein [Pseudoalteromonas sp.]|tara:strand:+ start:19942 stop:20199 length:258 start_codon:yes stop_codon:yes gene_type:complete
MVEYLRCRVWGKNEVNNIRVLKLIAIVFLPISLLGALLFEVVSPPAMIASMMTHYIIFFWMFFVVLIGCGFTFLFCLDKATAYPP